jgi:hypothetical protein
VPGLVSTEQLLFGKEVRGFARTKALEDTIMKVAPGESAELSVLARAMSHGSQSSFMAGFGMTEDLPLGAGLRRLKALSAIYGDERHPTQSNGAVESDRRLYVLN